MTANTNSKSNWPTVKFGDFAENVAVRVDPAEVKTDIYVGLEHLDPESLHLKKWGHPSDVTGQKLVFKKGDVIFGRRRAYQRKLAIAEFDGICSAHAMVVRAKPDMILPEFLPFFLQSDMFMERAIGISVGSLSPTINWRTLKVQKFRLPPIEEQKRIAEILGAVDAALEKWRSVCVHAVTSYSSFAEAVCQSFRGEYSPINALAIKGEKALKTGPFGSSLKTAYFRSEGVPVINISALGEGHMDSAGLFYISEERAKEFQTYAVRVGDLVFSRVADIGRCLVVDRDHAGAIISSNIIRIRVDSEKVRPQFLRLLLTRDPHVKKQIVAITATGGRTLVNTKTMQHLQFGVPPLNIQDRILDRIESFRVVKSRLASHEGALRRLSTKLCGELLSMTDGRLP